MIPENIHTLPWVAPWNFKAEGEGDILDWNSEGMGGVMQFGIPDAWGFQL